MFMPRGSIALMMAVIMLASQHVSAFPGYLDQIPNGDNIGMMIAHVHTRKLTKFGMLWFNAHRWSKICHETFPGTALTCGQALGDPCCTWKPGKKPDYILDEVSIDGTVCHNATSILVLPMKDDTLSTTSPPRSTTPAPMLRQHKGTDVPTSTQSKPANANEKGSAPEKPAWLPEEWHPNATRGFC